MELEKLKSKAYDFIIMRGRINQEILKLEQKIKNLYEKDKKVEIRNKIEKSKIKK